MNRVPNCDGYLDSLSYSAPPYESYTCVRIPPLESTPTALVDNGPPSCVRSVVHANTRSRVIVDNISGDSCPKNENERRYKVLGAGERRMDDQVRRTQNTTISRLCRGQRTSSYDTGT